MSVINTNILSLTTQNNLKKSQSALGSAIERLSSSKRINSAKDDAAGQAIANRFSVNFSGLKQAARNASDGISLAQAAEGAMEEININLKRIRDLTLQAQNGTNSASEIDALQLEVNQRMQEINRVAQQTEFNGIKVLADNSTTKDIKIQVGANDGQTITISLKANSGWNLVGAEISGQETTVAATGTSALVDAADRKIAKLDNGIDVLEAGVLKKLDDAINAISTQRSELGALQNRFESAVNNLNNTTTNLDAARSRIEDADYATEVSNMTRAQIIQQAGNAVLGQANQIPQNVLSLLR